MHSLLRLPVKGKKSDLSVATLQSLQALFQDCKFLIIDEKSMIDIKTLSLIDDRLRAILPAHSDQLCPGQGLQIQEQVRMLGLGHAYSRCHRRRAQPHGPRPRYCARKVGLCESHDSECLKV